MSTNHPVDPTDMNPVADTATGTPPDGADICPECEGNGILKDKTECTNCGGTGRIAQAVGGA
jgi:RecJ-like exonuclease